MPLAESPEAFNPGDVSRVHARAYACMRIVEQMFYAGRAFSKPRGLRNYVQTAMNVNIPVFSDLNAGKFAG
jgi:hypothetical protein